MLRVSQTAVLVSTLFAASVFSSVGLLVVSRPFSASAAVEGWHPGASWLPHAGWTTATKAVGGLTTGPWSRAHQDAVASWNGHFSSFVPFRIAGPSEGALVHLVIAGSFDEAVLDAFKIQEGRTPQGSCHNLAGGAYVWALVAIYFGAEIGDHSGDYKVCVWPSRVPQGWEYLTVKHELGHVLGLGDDDDGRDNCLMRSGTAMREICAAEVNWLKAHLGRN